MGKKFGNRSIGYVVIPVLLAFAACSGGRGSGKYEPTPTPEIIRRDVSQILSEEMEKKSEQKKEQSNLVPVTTLFPGAEKDKNTPTPAPKPTNSPKPTAKPKATNTPVPTLGPTNTPTLTPKPTNTPRPTKTPTPMVNYPPDAPATPTPGSVDYVIVTGAPSPGR